MRGSCLAVAAGLLIALSPLALGEPDDSAAIFGLSGITPGTHGVTDVGALAVGDGGVASAVPVASALGPSGRASLGTHREDFRRVADWSLGQAATAVGLTDRVDGGWRPVAGGASRAQLTVAVGPLVNGVATLAAVVVFFVVLIRREHRPRRVSAFR